MTKINVTTQDKEDLIRKANEIIRSVLDERYYTATKEANELYNELETITSEAIKEGC